MTTRGPPVTGPNGGDGKRPRTASRAVRGGGTPSRMFRAPGGLAGDSRETGLGRTRGRLDGETQCAWCADRFLHIAWQDPHRHGRRRPTIHVLFVFPRQKNSCAWSAYGRYDDWKNRSSAPWTGHDRRRKAYRSGCADPGTSWSARYLRSAARRAAPVDMTKGLGAEPGSETPRRRGRGGSNKSGAARMAAATNGVPGRLPAS